SPTLKIDMPGSILPGMNLSDLRTLLDYHYWARDRVLDAVAALTPEQFTRDLGSSFPSVRDTIAHLHPAEWAWYGRCQGRSPAAPLPADRFGDPSAVGPAWTDLEANVRAFVNGLDEAAVDRVFEYKLLGGQPGSSPLWQMVQHVVNHGSYH